MSFDTIWTRYAEARMLAAVFQGVAIPVAAADWKIGLLQYKGGADITKIPGRDDVIEVPSGANPSYLRRALGAMTLAEPANGVPSVTNAAGFLFPEALEAWGLTCALGLFDPAGNLWAISPTAVADQRTVRMGDVIEVKAGTLVWTGFAPLVA